MLGRNNEIAFWQSRVIIDNIRNMGILQGLQGNNKIKLTPLCQDSPFQLALWPPILLPSGHDRSISCLCVISARDTVWITTCLVCDWIHYCQQAGSITGFPGLPYFPQSHRLPWTPLLPTVSGLRIRAHGLGVAALAVPNKMTWDELLNLLCPMVSTTKSHCIS